MKLRSTLMLPREHGAWAMLYVPFALGVAVASRVSLPVLLLLGATTALFISRESLLVWWRARHHRRRTPRSEQASRFFLVYFAVAGTSGAPLIMVYKLHWLLPLALIGLLLFAVNGKQATKFEDRTIQSEVVAIVGLTMTAAAAYYVARGQWHQTALWLWALAAAYFASSVFYVKLRVVGLHAKQAADRERARWQCAGYHSFLLVSLLSLALTRSLPLFALIAFAPVLARTCWGLLKPSRTLNLKRIGIAEIVYSIIFLIFITLTLR
jgi:hypothetical protein